MGKRTKLTEEEKQQAKVAAELYALENKLGWYHPNSRPVIKKPDNGNTVVLDLTTIGDTQPLNDNVVALIDHFKKYKYEQVVNEIPTFKNTCVLCGQQKIVNKFLDK